VGVFCGYESCAHGFVYSTVRGIMSFITSIRRYGRLVTERKKKNFDLFAVSVIKNKEIVHILIAPSSHSKL